MKKVGAKPDGWSADMLVFEPQKKFGGERMLGLASIFIPAIVAATYPLLPIPPWMTVAIAVAVYLVLRVATAALWHYDKWALKVYSESVQFPEFIPSHTSAYVSEEKKAQLHRSWTKMGLRRK